MRLLRPSALPTLRAAPRPRSKACARVVLHRPKTTRYTATMEPGAASQEQADFNNVAVTRYAAAGHNGSAAVARLGLGSGQQTGPAKTLQVAKGDTITFTAYAWLTAAVAATSNSTSPKNPPLVLPAPQPSTAPPAAPGADGAPTKRSGLPTVGISVALPIGGPDDATPQGGGAPGIARLHYRVLDAQGTVLLDDYQTANGAAPATWQTLQVGLRLPQAGSVQLSVETNGAAGPTVYFDDVSVEQTGGLIVQEQHQYAFGAPLPGLSYTVGSTRYRHGYQGQFADKDEETGFDSFELRLYNSRIGRWMAPDPAGQFDSPYVGMGNNPVTSTDPDGGYAGIFANAFIRTGVFAAAGFTAGAVTAGATGGNALQGGLIGAGVGIGASFINANNWLSFARAGAQSGASLLHNRSSISLSKYAGQLQLSPKSFEWTPLNSLVRRALVKNISFIDFSGIELGYTPRAFAFNFEYQVPLRNRMGPVLSYQASISAAAATNESVSEFFKRYKRALNTGDIITAGKGIQKIIERNLNKKILGSKVLWVPITIPSMGGKSAIWE